MTAAPAMHPGTVIGDRYELQQPICRGGMGDVWAASDALLGRPVALKLVTPGGEDHAARQQALMDEARRTAKVAHRNVVVVLDCGREGDVAHLAMELLEGGTLRDRLRHGRLPLAELRRVARDLLCGLEATHAAGLAHCDVKPTNVLRSPDGRWKLADFGAAAPLAPVYGVTALAASIVGTPGYLAPERLVGRPATVASDLYAAAIVLQEAATGVPPMRSTEVATQPVPVVDVREVGSPLRARAAFVEALEAALHRDPTKRPASAAQMFDQIDAAVRAALHGGERAVRCTPAVRTATPRTDAVPAPTAPRAGAHRPPRRRAALAGAVASLLVAGWAAFGDAGASTPPQAEAPAQEASSTPADAAGS